MKKLIFVAFVALLAFGLFGQQRAEDYAVDVPVPDQYSITSADVVLKEISIDKFETEGSWNSAISSDEGYIRSRLFEGSPRAKRPIPDEEGLNISDNSVLGTKVEFYRRGHNTFTVTAARPLPIEGVGKTVSVWVVGRNFNHRLNLLLRDYQGRDFELYMGKLNHSGWKQMSVSIPPQHPNGKNGIIQTNYHYGNRSTGLRIIGFRIDCDPEDAYGSYFIYFDDLRVVADIYDLQYRDEDDMLDSW